MATSIEATVILSDGAQAADGKLYVLGGGWTRLAAGVPAAIALGILFHIPYDMTNRKLAIAAKLLDDDGASALINGNEVHATGEIEMGRPPGTKLGETLSLPLAMNFQGVVLEPGGYVFEVSVQDEVLSRCPFRVA